MSRDWMASLWPASYKGIPFWVEKDVEDGGSRLDISMFPGKNDPFIENMGEAKREFDVTGYLIGDLSDVESNALVAQMATDGAGLLVLPLQGPIQAWCHTFKRDRERDKMGRVGIVGHFVRAGASSPLQPAEFLAQLVFDAVDSLAAAVPAFVAAVSL